MDIWTETTTSCHVTATSRTTWVIWYDNADPFWVLLQQKVMEMVMTTRTVRRVQIICTQLQSNRHHQHTNIQHFLQANGQYFSKTTVSDSSIVFRYDTV